MLDINNLEIRVGDTIETCQPNGGILPPAKPSIGVVEKVTCPFGTATLQIRYRRTNQVFDSFILLNGKINKIITPSKPL